MRQDAPKLKNYCGDASGARAMQVKTMAITPKYNFDD
jgi:hypothetical protein